jgi:hypothetical protein
LKLLKFGLIPALLLLLAACSNDSQAIIKVNLAPVPYSIEVPAEIAKHLSIENMVTSTPNEFTNQAREAGAIAQVYINYKAADGTMHGFAGVYYFKKTDFEKAGNPNEPPLYGSMVVEEKSMVLAIAGPQESIFDPLTQDGKNSMDLYTIIYKPSSYTPTSLD